MKNCKDCIHYNVCINHEVCLDYLDDVAPVIHARWIDKTDWYKGIGMCHYVCSNCGYEVHYKPDSRKDGKGGKYCDNCGAKMNNDIK